MKIYPVILSGGTGTRLWPMSRESLPKQFLPLLDGRSPFQGTLARLQGVTGAQPAMVIANNEHRFLVQDQAREARAPLRALYLEPVGRNTAPAAAVAALQLLREDPDALMLILPADHEVEGVKGTTGVNRVDGADGQNLFAQAVEQGVAAALAGRLVVFGIPPRWSETGYGYIERGSPLENVPDCFHVASFIEKPEIEIARRLAASGRHFWNSGMFLFSARQFLAELRHWQPELAGACQAAAAAITEDAGCRRLNAATFSLCASISIDYAVMEKTGCAAVVPTRFSWSDIGSWNALWERAEKDSSGNAATGDVYLQDASDSFVWADRRMVVGIGLRDMVIVETPDAVLVADRSKVQCVREAVEHLRQHDRPEHRTHRRVKRPWGHYEDIDAGDRFRVKRIVVEPGAKLSLQLHHHRAEHWVIVTGTARITRGDEVITLTENQSTYIPLGAVHRLENPGKIPLQMIEIQSGAYLEEDDIVRIEDQYHRA